MLQFFNMLPKGGRKILYTLYTEIYEQMFAI